MCGILGVYDPNGILIPRERFAAALDRLRRRGPDDGGVWSDDRVQLGHRRLSIVDLSPAGHQPMPSSDRRFHIVFNGEIYNHRELRPLLDPVGGWRGSSDTETLIEAYRQWGTQCVERINGMFAFAIWDRVEQSLFIARDRMGVKPLYYSLIDRTLMFASRPSALLTLRDDLGADVDPEALRVFLELGYIPAPLSAHRQIRKLPPGHFLLVSPKAARLVRYWDFRFIPPDANLRNRPVGELAEELCGLVQDSVKSRLMSDVPLGAFLSSGVDSSMVLASMRAAGVERPKTFTISFQDRQFDEGPTAARIAHHLGSDHVSETLAVTDLLNLMPMYIDEYDEPFADSSAFATLAVARLARRHVTVALTGDGADELFGGYHYYQLANRLHPVLRWQPTIKSLLARVAKAAPFHRAKLFSGMLACDDPVSLFNYLRSVSKDYPALIPEELLESTSSSQSWFDLYAADFPLDLTAAETGMRLDAGFTLPELFLQKVDVATMAFSLEARCPMTDFRLVEWSMRLPLEYKVSGSETKILLKRALCKYLPPEYVYRPKMGFSVPLANWLRGPLRDWARELLYDETLASKLPLHKDRIRSLFEQHQSGARDAHPLLWSVLMLYCFINKHCGNRALPALPLKAVA